MASLFYNKIPCVSGLREPGTAHHRHLWYGDFHISLHGKSVKQETYYINYHFFKAHYPTSYCVKIIKNSYLWQETEMDLWWDQDIPQYWPGLQQSCPPVLLAALKLETSLLNSVFIDVSILSSAFVSKLIICGGYLPPHSSSKAGACSSTFSVLLFPAITVMKGEWTRFEEICLGTFAQMSLKWIWTETR